MQAKRGLGLQQGEDLKYAFGLSNEQEVEVLCKGEWERPPSQIDPLNLFKAGVLSPDEQMIALRVSYVDEPCLWGSCYAT